MDRASVAEWLLRRVVDPARASELVGDQLEAHPDAGSMSFWMSIAQVWLMFSWRTIVGTVVSPLVGMIIAFALFVFTNLHPGSIWGFPEMTTYHVRVYLLGFSILLWAVTIFSLIRFSWRSSMAGVGLVASLLWSVSLSSFWLKTPSIVLAILWTGFIAICFRDRKLRSALGAVFGAAFAAWLVAFALSVLPRDPYSVFGKWQFLTALCLVPIVQSVTAMYLQRKFNAAQNIKS